MLLREVNGVFEIRLNKNFYSIDKIISVLSKYENYCNSSINVPFSSISDETYIRIKLTPKRPIPIRKIINGMID